jgi:hypothetical protein
LSGAPVKVWVTTRDLSGMPDVRLSDLGSDLALLDEVAVFT